MYEVISSCNGSIIKFGGDSILTIFEGSSEDTLTLTKLCVYKMHQKLTNLNIIFKKNYDIEISIHYGFYWGQVQTVVVGDESYHFDFYMTGKALREACCNERNLDFSKIDFTTSNCGGYEQKNYRIPISFHHSKILQQFDDSIFKAELRNVATVFLSLDSSYGDEIISPEAYNDYYIQLQRIVYPLDGTINKIDYNDKGYMVLITFGIPKIHQDDIERAFACSLKILNIHSNAIKCRIGLTYSNIYCGVLGAYNRCEYGIIGNAVNLAARLMSNADYGNVVFTSEIAEKISDQFEIANLKKIKVKGIKNEVELYTIIRYLPDLWLLYKKRYDKIDWHCDEKIEKETDLNGIGSNLTIISGQHGVGKSLFLYKYLSKLDKDKKFDLFLSEDYKKNIQLGFIEEMIKRKINISQLDQDFSLVYDYCKINNIPINEKKIKEYLDTDFSDIDTTSLELVFSNLSDIIYFLYRNNSVIVFDNIHSMDFISFEILKLSINRWTLENVMIILTTLDEKDILSHFGKRVYSFKLQNFSKKYTWIYLTHYLPYISKETGSAIYEVSKGNPAFLYELVSVILKHLKSDNEIFQLNDFDNLQREGFISDKLETYLIKNYDQFDRETKEILKIASIVGSRFQKDIISQIQNHFFSEHIKEILDQLKNNEILTFHENYPESEYIFQNSLMRVAIYNTILKGEKRKLHNQIASYYENKFKDELYHYYEIIAGNYVKAENSSKACHFSFLAGVKSFKLASYSQSYYYLDIAYKHAENISQKDKIIIELVNTCIILGKTDEAQDLIASVNWNKHKEFYDRAMYLQLRIMEITKQYKTIKSFINRRLSTIQSKDYKDKIEIIYFDCLRILNEQDEFNGLKNRLMKKFVLEKKYENYIRLFAILGQHEINNGKYKLAKSTFKNLLDKAKLISDKIYQRIALTNLGKIESWLGNQDKALNYHNQAMKISDTIGDKSGYSKCLSNIATIDSMRGKYHDAIDLYRKSLYLSRCIGDMMQENIALYQIGQTYYLLDDFERAIKFFNFSKEIAEQIPDYIGISYANDAIGDIFFRKNNYTKASLIYKQNYMLQKKIHDIEGIGHTLGNLGNIALMQNNFRKAEFYYKKQYNSLHKIGDISGTGRALFNWANLEYKKQNISLAIEKMKSALELFKKSEEKKYIEAAELRLKEFSKSNLLN